MLLFHLHDDLASLLRSGGAKEEIHKQMLEAFDSVVAPHIGEIVMQLRLEGAAAIEKLEHNSTYIRAEHATSLTQAAEKLRAGMDAQLVTFLCSTKGQELLLGLLREAIAESGVALFSRAVEFRLKEVAANEVAVLVTDAGEAVEKCAADVRARLQREVEAFDRQADEIAHTLKKAEAGLAARADVALETFDNTAEEFEQRVYEMRGELIDRVFRETGEKLRDERERLIAWSFDEVRRRLADFIDYELPAELRDAVERHVANGPRFVRPYSNRWLAAELGISLREVKRRRRRGELP